MSFLSALVTFLNFVTLTIWSMASFLTFALILFFYEDRWKEAWKRFHQRRACERGDHGSGFMTDRDYHVWYAEEFGYFAESTRFKKCTSCWCRIEGSEVVEEVVPVESLVKNKIVFP